MCLGGARALEWRERRRLGQRRARGAAARVAHERDLRAHARRAIGAITIRRASGRTKLRVKPP